MEPLTLAVPPLGGHHSHRARLASPSFDRRVWLRGAASLAAANWLTPVAHVLAGETVSSRRPAQAQSVILIWLGGGASQLETFDPHPAKAFGGPTKSIKTAAPGIELAAGFERLAEQMQHVSLVRSVTSKEGDHERGTYAVKTGYVPDPTVVHPSIGAIICHELPEQIPGLPKTDVPRHVSILANQWSGRGGFLGDQYDAFKTYDPNQRVPDVNPSVPDARYEQRIKDLAVVERAFAQGRQMQAQNTLHQETVQSARLMMTSEQRKAFETVDEPAAVRAAYGDTPFGRGCLAARRLIEVGVRCVEVSLYGWDTHADNFDGCQQQLKILDPALASLLRELRERSLLDRTIVLVAGEFGRTPAINKLDGRDHWPHGFSIALAGGGLRGGQVIGATDPDGGKNLHDPRKVADIHATVLAALGLDPHKENVSPALRPLKLADGEPIRELLA